MQVTFYLTQASANTAAGPFNISGTTSGGAANTIEIQAGVSKATLLTGYTEEIANNITGGTVTSTGATCNTTDTWSINELYVTIEASAGGYMEPCVGGSIDDHMGANVNLTAPVTVDTNFDVTVYYKSIGNSCSYPNITTGANTQSFSVTVLAGQSSGSINACSNGLYISAGANVCGACVTSSDNTVDRITFVNPVGC
jgi:hypothetical protein